MINEILDKEYTCIAQFLWDIFQERSEADRALRGCSFITIFEIVFEYISLLSYESERDSQQLSKRMFFIDGSEMIRNGGSIIENWDIIPPGEK